LYYPFLFAIVSFLVKLEDHNPVLPRIVLALALGTRLQGKCDNEFVIIGRSLCHVHAGRHAVQVMRNQVFTHFTVSTLFEFANSYLLRNESKYTKMFFFIVFHLEFVVRHQHRRIPLFVGHSLLLVIVLSK
jgi:hypothetical protein